MNKFTVTITETITGTKEKLSVEAGGNMATETIVGVLTRLILQLNLRSLEGSGEIMRVKHDA